MDNESIADFSSVADNECFLPEYVDDENEDDKENEDDDNKTIIESESEFESNRDDDDDKTARDSVTPHATTPIPLADALNTSQATSASFTAQPAAAELEEKYDHLQQLFITKNPNLCKEVEHIFTNLTHAYPREACARIRVENSPMPTRLQNAHPDSFPYFLTLKEFLIILGMKH